MEPQIYLLCAPSNTGKTTALSRYVDVLRKNAKSVGGVLQIVKNGKRNVRLLSDDSMKLLQINEVDAHNIKHDRHYIKQHGNTGRHCNHKHKVDNTMNHDYDKNLYIKCGRFLLSKQALNDAQNELNKAHNFDFIMIDEIGPWELNKGKGYEPAFSNVLKQRRNKFKKSKFIIVIRPSLKERLIQYLDLKKGEYTNFEELYDWQLSAKVCRRFVFASFFTCIALSLSKKLHKQS